MATLGALGALAIVDELGKSFIPSRTVNVWANVVTVSKGCNVEKGRRICTWVAGRKGADDLLDRRTCTGHSFFGGEKKLSGCNAHGGGAKTFCCNAHGGGPKRFVVTPMEGGQNVLL